jgi:methylated-DNA-[protein]-cysteine S-methyltransferase
MTSVRILVTSFPSPIGPLALAVRNATLVRLDLDGDLGRLGETLARRFGDVALEQASDPAGIAARLGRYFAGGLAALDEIDVDPGGTPFQSRVWLKLREIRPGRTWSYAELAVAVGRPSAVRAVGAANGANPISLVLPCHRVIGSDGSLTGYGGGLDRKRWLLAHEGARPEAQRSLLLPAANVTPGRGC